jgi:uncharacterized protein (DUF885 family)
MIFSRNCSVCSSETRASRAEGMRPRAIQASARRVAVLSLLVLAASYCGSACAQAPARPEADPAFGTLEHEYAVYFMGRFPVVATYLGGSAFDPALAGIDGKLRDYSPQALQAEDAQLTKFRARFTALAPERLSAARRIDRAVALAEIEFLLHQHQVRRHQERSLDSYVDEPFRGVDWQIQGMTPTGAATYGTDSEWRAVIARARAVTTYLANAQRQIAAGVARKNTPDFRVLFGYGLGSTGADAEYFAKTLPGIAAQDIAGSDRQALLADLGSAGNAASAAYLGLRDFVIATFFDSPAPTDATALKAQFRADHFAFGEQEYDWALNHNFKLHASARELFSASWPIVEATRASMVELARTIAANHKWQVSAQGSEVVRAVFENLSHDAPKTDDEMIDWYRKSGARIVSYARATGLFDVPSDYRLDVIVTPPPLRASIEGAAYYAAPPFKKTGVGRFYVTPTGNNLAELAQEHNRAAVPDLAAHEGFPGHDWHYKVMAQYKEGVSPVRWLTPGAVEDSSSMWQDSLAAEGWALYAEALLAEPQPGAREGFYTPEEHLYQLRGKLYRDLRVRIDTGIHIGLMSFEDAVTLFSEVVDFLPGSCADPNKLTSDSKRASCNGARAAAARYSRLPTQAITYRLGKEQILALRRAAQDALGPRFSAQRFHLEFMKEGAIPAAYFGAELLRTLGNTAP